MYDDLEENPFPPEGAPDGWRPPTSDDIARAYAAQQEEKATELFGSALTGDAFVFGGYSKIEPLWGTDEQTAWAAGEAMMIFGPQGTGKTTVVQQVMKGRIGLVDEVLGMPVAEGSGKVLYLAMDRPRQAARSMERMFTEDADADVLRDRLVVWRGPLPFHLVADPARLSRMADYFGADTVIVDSLKDLAPKLADDETGSVINTAFQQCLVDGVEVIDLHHPRKAGAKEKGEAKSVDDIYGSTWLTSGHGSILCINGQPGDLAVTLTQLKDVNERVGPLQVEHDHDRGVSRVVEQFDMLVELRSRGSFTVADAALAMCGNQERNSKARARRSLTRLVDKGLAELVGGGDAAVFRPVGEYTVRRRPVEPSPF